MLNELALEVVYKSCYLGSLDTLNVNDNTRIKAALTFDNLTTRFKTIFT